ncbi:hypothetical protein [Peribacillus butanolivorans]|uniref:Uncharacterized protein n=1 Tax=Peribacillus butanolivorans TaxID=421767 RepID=A0AAX0S451_9BACI|nr:hypothetical protein [Peribacillus butanolivorans]AXN40663.1 hypothetical protein DTO10_21280 [Peribacillus butanolivorans]PEJ34944.1 hypothetical protein CN689_06370 [Peribacillus butanolivorans]QNU05452.1 hypothetical protein GM240_17110 [Peribacillus butanolivorans]
MEKEKKERKIKHLIKWKVDRYRTDKRTGAISPVKPSRYVQYAYDELERQFPKDPPNYFSKYFSLGTGEGALLSKKNLQIPLL